MHILKPKASLTNEIWLLMLVLMRHKFDVIKWLGNTESFLDDSVHDSHLLFLGYVAYRRDHDRHGG